MPTHNTSYLFHTNNEQLENKRNEFFFRRTQKLNVGRNVKFPQNSYKK